MFNLIFVLFFAILGCIGLVIPNEYAIYVSCVLFAISFVWLFIATINNLTIYSNQLLRFEEVINYLNSINIYKKKQEELLIEFKKYLGEKYPELEERIFSDINKTGDKMKIILEYPELKSSKTFLKLADKINNLADSVYRLMLKLEDICELIRYYKNGKWEFIKPQIPKDIKDVVYNKTLSNL